MNAWIKSLWTVAILSIVGTCSAHEGDQVESERAKRRKDQVQLLMDLSATVFTRNDSVIEVNANRTKIADKDLALVSEFTQMTDLSLEETTITDAGLVHLRNLRKLEWLNLYRSRIGNRFRCGRCPTG